MPQLARPQTPTQQTTGTEDGPAAPKVERKIAPELQTKLDELEKRLPKTAAEVGTEKDAALAYVQAEYKACIEKFGPDRTQQFRLLQQAAVKTGGVTSPEYLQLMQQFAERQRNGEPGILPEPLEKARTLVRKAETDAKPDSVAREALLALDKSAIDITLPALARRNYSEAIKAIHEASPKPDQK